MSESSEKPEVSDLTRTLLESGLVDDSMVQLLEKWQVLPDGSTQYVNNDALKDATRRQLQELVEKIGDGVESHRTLRETYFDLDRLRWPTQLVVGGVLCTAMVDRMDRYYFRIQDVAKMVSGSLQPGKFLEYNTPMRPDPDQYSNPRAYTPNVFVRRYILEVTTLYVGEQPAAVQVTCGPEQAPPTMIDDRIGHGG